MSAHRDREEEIFDAARELASHERAAYLAERCGQDADLRQRIEGMLAADAAAGEFFKTHDAPSSTVIVADASLSPSIEKAGDRIGRYKLLQQIGEGGMGLVYMAEQDQPVRRSVALKIIKLGMDTRQVVARFEAERQALAMMNHPHIAKIFDAGATDSGRPYFVMELVRGIPITEYCDKNLLPTRERLDLFILVCQAVQHAHQKGVIHRDLKPSNILVTLNDGVPWPMIIDFGIAKATHQRLTEKTIFTHFAQMIGTPAYMSPEQAEMSKLDVDTRTDIYALGVLLYELLTGTTPFPTQELLSLGYREMQRTIVEREPLCLSTRLITMANEERTVVAKSRSTEASALAKLFRGDLDWIVMKCLEKDRTRRYETTNDLASDIQRHLSSEPVRARPPSNLYRFQKSFHRNKLAYAAAAAIATVLLFGSVISTWQAIRATQAEREQKRLRGAAETARASETVARQQAEAAERESQQQLYAALLEQARATVLSGEMGQRVRALDALRRAAAISNTVELRREVFAALALPDLRFERELPWGEEFVPKLDPSFERIALAVLRGRGPVEIRSTSDQRLLATLSASTNLPVYVMEWSADGRFLAVKRDYPPSGMRADWEVWETANWRRILLRRDLPLGAVAFHPRLPRVFLGQRNGAAIWDLESGTEVSRFQLAGTPFWLRFAPDGERFAALYELRGGWIASVHEVTNSSAAPLASPAFAARLSVCNWHPAGRWMALADLSGHIHWMDSQTGETRVLGRHRAEAVRAEFSPDGAYMISGAWGDELICWDVQTLQRAFNIRLNGFKGQFRADGRAYAVETRTGVRLHAFERPSGYREFAEDLGTRLDQAAFSSDGRWLAASADKRMGLWDLTVNGPGALDEKGQDAHCFFTADGRELFGSRSRPGKWTDGFRWRIAPATDIGGPPRLEPLRLYKPPGFTFLSLNSNSVVMTSTNGTQILAPEETDAGKEDWTRTHAGMNRPSPDGRWVGIFNRLSPSLYVHRLPSLERVAKLTHLPNIHHFEFSPLGDEVALCSRQGVTLWNTATWEQTRVLTNFTYPFLYAPDGRSLWLTKDSHGAGLYDARTLEPRLLLPAGMLPLAVSPDGRRIAVSMDKQRLQLWDLIEVRQRLRELGLDWAVNQ